MITKVIHKADNHGRIKIEQYTQTRVDNKILLDYREEFETVSQLPESSEKAANKKHLSDYVNIPGTEGRIVEVAESVETMVSEEDIEAMPESETLTEKEKTGNNLQNLYSHSFYYFYT